MKRDLISIHDLSAAEVTGLLELSADVKRDAGKYALALAGKSLGMIFQKSSTRTRVSFEVGMFQLGGQALFLSGRDIQLGRGETIHDTAKVMSRYVDGIMARTFAHQTVLDLARFGSVPVINGLTDLLHPCQILADLLTIQERFPRLDEVTIAYLGDGNNVANSLLYGAAKVGATIRVATPGGHGPNAEVAVTAKADAQASGATIEILEDPAAAVDGAHVIYTDTWTSMGQDDEGEARRRLFQPFQVNAELLAQARPEAIVMHCLPAHRGDEITYAVMDGPQSVVFDEAENRLHAQKAVMTLLM